MGADHLKVDFLLTERAKLLIIQLRSLTDDAPAFHISLTPTS